MGKCLLLCTEICFQYFKSCPLSVTCTILKKPIEISLFILSMHNMVQVLNQGNLLFLISEERFSFDFQR